MKRVGHSLLLVPAVLLALSGCGAGDEPNDQAATPKPAATAEPAASGTAPADDTSTGPATEQATEPAPTPTGPAVTRPPDPVAPAEITPVPRPNAPATRLSAPEGDKDTPVKYSDGVQITITSVERTTVTDTGPGVMTGAPLVTATVSVQNSGRTPVDLSSVVVSARYGEPAQLAPATYVDGSVDLSGQLAPGKTATGTYSFQIPAENTALTVVVDADAVREPAVFRSVK